MPDATASTRTTTITPFTVEAAADIAPSRLRSWRIREAAGGATNAHGHLIGYELVPLESGHRDEGPSFEPFTHDDFYVTRYSACEQFASHNNQLLGCGDHLQDFVSGQSIDGEDIVAWYGMTFHHIPRDEDEAHMHAHWNGFRLEPRDWSDATPSIPEVVSCPPDSIDFDALALESYANQDGTGTAVSQDDGQTLRMTGNSWKRSATTWNIETGTQLHFEFASQIEGELHTIGFDDDAELNDEARHFFLHGSQSWSGGGRIDVTPDYGGAGTYQSFSFTLSDYFTGSGMHLVFGNDQDSGAQTNEGRYRCVRIVQPNAPPVWTDPGPLDHQEGESVSITLLATDPNGNAVSYTSTPLPPGLTLASATGRITGTLDYTAAAGSPYTIVATADDGTHTTDQSFDWTVANVNRAPVWVDPGAQSSAEGDAVNLVLMASDPDAESVTFGATGLPGGLGLNATTGLISGTIDYAAAATLPYTIVATASDAETSVEQSFTWLVTDTNRPPTLDDPGDQTSEEGDPISLALVASDPDPEDELVFSATNLPPGLDIDAETGAITGIIGDTAGDSGQPYPVVLGVSDGDVTVEVLLSWTIEVENEPEVPSSTPIWLAILLSTLAAVALASTRPHPIGKPSPE